MKYYLFAESGGCNYGDHEVTFQEFDTVEAAREKLKELKELDSYTSYKILCGEVIEEGD